MFFKLVHSVCELLSRSDQWNAPLCELNVAMVAIQAFCILFQYSSKCGHPIPHVNIVWTPRIRQTLSGEEAMSGVSRLLWLWVRHDPWCLCTSSVCFCCHSPLREVRCNLKVVLMKIFNHSRGESQGILYQLRKILNSTSKSGNFSVG